MRPGWVAQITAAAWGVCSGNGTVWSGLIARAGRHTHSVRAELHEVAGGITDVEPTAVAAGAPQIGGTHHDVEAPGRGELIEVDALDRERDVIDVLAGALALQHVDQRRRVHAQR